MTQNHVRNLILGLLVLLVAAIFYGLGKRHEAEVIPPLPEDTTTAAAKSANSGARALQEAFVSVAKEAEPAVVHIRATRALDPNELFWYRFWYDEEPGESLGSGFIFHSDGYILTNFHAVAQRMSGRWVLADVITVGLMGKREIQARVCGVDPWRDLAVLKIKSDKPLPSLALGDSDKVEVGEWAIAIGNPFGLEHTMTVGVISAKGREFDQVGGQPSLHSYIQTDALINPGNSGGPLLNIEGKVIGINNFIYDPTGRGVGFGYGFAIPINSAKAVLERLMKGERITRGFLGVTVDDADSPEVEALGYPRHKGAFVVTVSEGSPAYNAGIRPGDVIVKFNGKTVVGANQLIRYIWTTPPQTAVSIEILRSRQRITVTARLGGAQ